MLFNFLPVKQYYVNIHVRTNELVVINHASLFHCATPLFQVSIRKQISGFPGPSCLFMAELLDGSMIVDLVHVKKGWICLILIHIKMYCSVRGIENYYLLPKRKHIKKSNRSEIN